MKVRINNESSFFHDMVGKVVPGEGSGIWVKIKATPKGVARRLWFTKGEVVVVPEEAE